MTVEVQKIILTQEQQQEVNDTLKITKTKYRLVSNKGRRDTVRKKFYHGLCHICHDFPSYKVLHKLPDITLVEYYCEQHKKHIPS